MSDSDQTSQKKPWVRMFLISCAVAVALCIGWTALRAHWSHQRRAEWMKQVEHRGAKAIIASYSDGGLLAKVPVLNAIFTRNQVVVFIPNSQTADSVLELLPEYAELRRLWVHKDNVNQQMVERIRAARPDVGVSVESCVW